jgi:hypothetical protein
MNLLRQKYAIDELKVRHVNNRRQQLQYSLDNRIRFNLHLVKTIT